MVGEVATLRWPKGGTQLTLSHQEAGAHKWATRGSSEGFFILSRGFKHSLTHTSFQSVVEGIGACIRKLFVALCPHSKVPPLMPVASNKGGHGLGPSGDVALQHQVLWMLEPMDWSPQSALTCTGDYCPRSLPVRSPQNLHHPRPHHLDIYNPRHAFSAI